MIYFLKSKEINISELFDIFGFVYFEIRHEGFIKLSVNDHVLDECHHDWIYCYLEFANKKTKGFVKHRFFDLYLKLLDNYQVKLEFDRECYVFLEGLSMTKDFHDLEKEFEFNKLIEDHVDMDNFMKSYSLFIKQFPKDLINLIKDYLFNQDNKNNPEKLNEFIKKKKELEDITEITDDLGNFCKYFSSFNFPKDLKYIISRYIQDIKISFL